MNRQQIHDSLGQLVDSFDEEQDAQLGLGLLAVKRQITLARERETENEAFLVALTKYAECSEGLPAAVYQAIGHEGVAKDYTRFCMAANRFKEELEGLDTKTCSTGVTTDVTEPCWVTGIAALAGAAYAVTTGCGGWHAIIDFFGGVVVGGFGGVMMGFPLNEHTAQTKSVRTQQRAQRRRVSRVINLGKQMALDLDMYRTMSDIALLSPYEGPMHSIAKYASGGNLEEDIAKVQEINTELTEFRGKKYHLNVPKTAHLWEQYGAEGIMIGE